MSKLRCVFCALAAATLFFLSAAAAWAGDLQLSIANGRVTLVAENVSVRTILSEWARVGQTRIVNAEKLVGPPVTLTLVDVSETHALDVLLRSASGYMAAPRAATSAGASQYDRILILATSRPTVTAPAAPPSGFPGASPRFQAPQPMVQQPVDPDDEEPNDGPPPAMPVMTQPGFMPQPGAPPAMTNQPGYLPPSGATQTPSTPLMIPGQQPQPGQVTAPVLTLPRPGQLPTPHPTQPTQPKPIP